jgi:pimeloyl-[acyl-carrier protein] methyl ester esterase
MSPVITRSGPRLVLVHGWGFDHRLWQGLCSALPELDAVTIDLGFFGPPNGPAFAPDRPVVAVGHSLGVLWLLHTRPFRWHGLVSLNGFPRFVDAPDYAPAVPARLVDRMLRRLPADPAGVTQEFRRRCGESAPLPDRPVPDSLLAGLIWLRHWDARPVAGGVTTPAPILALSGGADPILPVGMDEHCFLNFPEVTTVRLAHGGHLLPLTEPDWCAGRIREFLDGLRADAKDEARGPCPPDPDRGFALDPPRAGGPWNP